ncbi:hypothetical protein A9Q99_04645 [Gammaproteobacteria bacterium 45_16_T64]|nr:hypothetical protein A9Q99_04645 [Gammaproteobacteria bacterium 45_16_T64]
MAVRRLMDTIVTRSWFVLVFSVSVGMAFFLTANLLIERVERQGVVAQNALVKTDLRNLRIELEGLINQSIYLTYGIQAHIAVEGGIEKDTFSSLSAALVKHSRCLRNISLIRGHELVMVYPLQGNEDAIGLRFDKRQINGFEKAIEYQSTILLGPIELVQGGSGLIARTPVYVNGDKYWGQTAVVLDWDVIKQRIRLNRFLQNYRLHVSSLSDDGHYLNNILGEKLHAERRYTQSEFIDFPHANWKLTATPKEVYKFPWRASWMLLVSLLSMCVSFFIFRYLSQVEDLRTQKRLALQLSNSKSQLLLSTVHDLRQPVNALSITINQLKENNDPNCLEHAELCLVSINEFFEQLVSYEQLETGKQLAVKETFCLMTLLEDLVEEIRPFTQRQGLQLAMQSDSDTQVFSDKALLRRVIRNLLSNAIDNTNEGGISISTSASDNTVDVRIIDTGVGIPKQDLSYVTEPFYQVNKGIERSGIGLGLDIVARLCAMLGVTFSLESEEGNGCLALVKIPRSSDGIKVEGVTGNVTVRLLEEVSMPSTLRDKFCSWGVSWCADSSALVNLLVTASPLEELELDSRLRSWSQPTLILSNTIDTSKRLSESVWVLPLSHPVSNIRRTFTRILDDVSHPELLE